MLIQSHQPAYFTLTQYQVAMHQPETWGYVQFEELDGEARHWLARLRQM